MHVGPRQSPPDVRAERRWSAPTLRELPVAATLAGSAPGVTETMFSDDSLAPS